MGLQCMRVVAQLRALPALLRKHVLHARREEQPSTSACGQSALDQPLRVSPIPALATAVMSLSGAGFAKGAVANLNLAFGGECAVDAMAPTAAGFHDVFGNLWQVRCAVLRALRLLW